MSGFGIHRLAGGAEAGESPLRQRLCLCSLLAPSPVGDVASSCGSSELVLPSDSSVLGWPFSASSWAQSDSGDICRLKLLGDCECSFRASLRSCSARCLIASSSSSSSSCSCWVPFCGSCFLKYHRRQCSALGHAESA